MPVLPGASLPQRAAGVRCTNGPRHAVIQRALPEHSRKLASATLLASFLVASQPAIADEVAVLDAVAPVETAPAPVIAAEDGLAGEGPGAQSHGCSVAHRDAMPFRCAIGYCYCNISSFLKRGCDVALAGLWRHASLTGFACGRVNTASYCHCQTLS